MRICNVLYLFLVLFSTAALGQTKAPRNTYANGEAESLPAAKSGDHSNILDTFHTHDCASPFLSLHESRAVGFVYEASVGMYKGSSDVKGWERISEGRSFAVHDLPLSGGFGYFFNVRKINTTSNVVTPISSTLFRYSHSHNKVLVIAGQSNAQGKATSDQMSKYTQNYEFSRTLMWEEKSGSWQPFILKKGVNYGAEVSFAMEFEKAQRTDKLFVIKYAEGGAGLDRTFKAWHPQSNAMFPFFIKRHYLPAIKLLGSDFTMLGIFWMQGETDASSDGPAYKYLENLNEFFAKLHLDAQEIKNVFLGRVHDSAILPKGYEIRHAQMEWAKSYGGGVLLDTDNLDHLDPSHYSALGSFILGRALYEKVRLKLKPCAGF